MAKTKKPEQAIFYQNFKGAIYGGTPEQVKNLMTAFCQYAFDGVETPSVAPDIAMTFGMMKASVDADRKHYQEVCEQNRINALKKTGLTISGYVRVHWMLANTLHSPWMMKSTASLWQMQTVIQQKHLQIHTQAIS